MPRAIRVVLSGPVPRPRRACPGPTCAPTTAPTSPTCRSPIAGHPRRAAGGQLLARGSGAARWCTARSTGPRPRGLHGQLLQPGQRPAGGPDPFQRLQPAVHQVQQRLDRQRGTEHGAAAAPIRPPRRRYSRVSTYTKVDVASPPAVGRARRLASPAAPPAAARPRRAPRSPGPSRASGSRPPATATPSRGHLLRRGPGRVDGPGQVAGQVHRDDSVAPCPAEPAVRLGEGGRRPAARW